MGESKFKQFRCLIADQKYDDEGIVIQSTIKQARIRIDLSLVISYMESSSVLNTTPDTFDCTIIDFGSGENTIVTDSYDKVDKLMKTIYPEKFAI
jgi:hypothetical protein